jgi:hypothetical protein
MSANRGGPAETQAICAREKIGCLRSQNGYMMPHPSNEQRLFFQQMGPPVSQNTGPGMDAGGEKKRP